MSQIQPPGAPPLDFNQAPYLVLWELTRACALACKHCRARAIKRRNPDELSLDECKQLLDRLAQFGKPLIVLTGGDPTERPDLFDIIAEAKARGFVVAITPSATPRATRETIEQFAAAKVDRVAVSIDGPNPEVHDSFRRVEGSFLISEDIARWCAEFNMPLQINTTIWRGNLHLFDDMAAMTERLGAVLWSLFFLVPTGRATMDMQISAAECEDVMRKMAALSQSAPFDVKATAAPHFRRVLLQYLEQTDGKLQNINARLKLGALRSYQSVNDGKGIMFISHTGDVYPSGFLPVSAGNVRKDDVVGLYRQHVLFTSLRDANALEGKCGRCRYKVVCGGSRARAFGETQNYLAQDNLCIYDEALVSAQSSFDGTTTALRATS